MADESNPRRHQIAVQEHVSRQEWATDRFRRGKRKVGAFPERNDIPKKGTVDEAPSSTARGGASEERRVAASSAARWATKEARRFLTAAFFLAASLAAARGVVLTA